MRFIPFLCLTLVCLTSIPTTCLAVEKPSCINYSKGSYQGNVTSEPECRTACEKAEGLPKPDFKTSVCEDGNMTVVASFKCNCKNEKTAYRDSINRGLCEDDVCTSSSDSSGSVNIMVVSTSILMITMLIFN
mmetsp:Transcript_155/g.186  ORF Transcript_155/g.186 Transcript_155/m.186 type:complete len:132 (-) Transcript_155:99-494(-)